MGQVPTVAARAAEMRRTPDASTNALMMSLGGWFAIVGSLMAGVGNLVHPATPLDNPVGIAESIAENDAWFAIHFVIILGVTLMFGGLIGLYHMFDEGLPRALGRFALFFAAVGVSIGLIVVVLDGVAAKQLADEWAATSGGRGSSIALAQVLGNETLNFALASLFNFTFAGVTYIFFGAAVAASGRFSRWVGWIAVGAGVGSIGAALIQGVVGSPTLASRILTIFGPTVITLWTLSMGLHMRRRRKVMTPWPM